MRQLTFPPVTVGDMMPLEVPYALARSLGPVPPAPRASRDIEVDDSNRETYRELARAGLMVVGNSFAGGEESMYHVTKEGFERKAELLAATAPSPGSAAAPHR